MLLTSKMLETADACAEAVKLVKTNFPNGEEK
jgi:hypothetical protein